MYTVQVSRHTSPKEEDKELERERGGEAIEYKFQITLENRLNFE